MSTLSPAELSRYHRQVILGDIGPEGQRSLKCARVLVIGLGGLGSPASLYLAAAGVGTLGLADFDTVELHNLHRQVAHRTATIGQPKVESAAAQLCDLNPHGHYRLHPEGVQPENAVALFSEYDLIVDGSDNFGTRYLVTDAAFLAGKPVVYGSIFQFEGQVSFFHPQAGGPCYRCLFPKPPTPGTVPNCEEAGVLGALCGIVGSLQAIEAIKFLTGAGENLIGRLLVVEARNMEFRTIRLKKDPDCPLCSTRPEITAIDAERYAFSCEPTEPAPTMIDARLPDLENLPFEIGVEQAKALLDHPDFPVTLLDVREDFEVEICSLPNSLHLPMRQVPESWEDLPRDRPLLVYCHHGGRSGRITRFLRDRGLQRAMNLAGGIDQWARRIDPSMRRY